MASEMLSKVLDAENSDREAQKAAHEQAQITVDAAVEAGEGAGRKEKGRGCKESGGNHRKRTRTGACKRRESPEGGRGAQARSACPAAETHRADAIKAVMETVI